MIAEAVIVDEAIADEAIAGEVCLVIKEIFVVDEVAPSQGAQKHYDLLKPQSLVQ